MILANICHFSYIYTFYNKKIINNIEIKEIYIGFDPVTFSIRLKEIRRIKLIERRSCPSEGDIRNEHYPKQR